jgi:hypothetical protein
MEEEKEVSVEKEVKDRVNQIAAKLSNDHNILSLRGRFEIVLSKFYKNTRKNFH